MSAFFQDTEVDQDGGSGEEVIEDHVGTPERLGNTVSPTEGPSGGAIPDRGHIPAACDCMFTYPRAFN